MNKYKCILSLRVARHLLAEGCRMVDVETSHKHAGNLVFIFEDNQDLADALTKLPRKGR